MRFADTRFAVSKDMHLVIYGSVLEHLKTQATKIQSFLAGASPGAKSGSSRKRKEDEDAAADGKNSSASKKRRGQDKNAFFATDLKESEREMCSDAQGSSKVRTWSRSNHDIPHVVDPVGMVVVLCRQ